MDACKLCFKGIEYMDACNFKLVASLFPHIPGDFCDNWYLILLMDIKSFKILQVFFEMLNNFQRTLDPIETCPSLEILHLFFFFFFFNFLLQYPTNNILNSKQKLRNSLCTNNKLLSFSLSSLSLSQNYSSLIFSITFSQPIYIYIYI